MEGGRREAESFRCKLEVQGRELKVHALGATEPSEGEGFSMLSDPKAQGGEGRLPELKGERGQRAARQVPERHMARAIAGKGGDEGVRFALELGLEDLVGHLRLVQLVSDALEQRRRLAALARRRVDFRLAVAVLLFQMLAARM
jgi:hypothetical protein